MNNTIPDMTCSLCKNTIKAFHIITSNVDEVSCQVANYDNESRYETDFFHETTNKSETKVYCSCGKQVTNEQMKYLLSLKEK